MSEFIPALPLHVDEPVSLWGSTLDDIMKEHRASLDKMTAKALHFEEDEPMNCSAAALAVALEGVGVSAKAAAIALADVADAAETMGELTLGIVSKKTCMPVFMPTHLAPPEMFVPLGMKHAWRARQPEHTTFTLDDDAPRAR